MQSGMFCAILVEGSIIMNERKFHCKFFSGGFVFGPNLVNQY